MSLWNDRCGSASLEFAIVGPAFIAMTIVTLEFGMMLFARATLDTATVAAVREIQIGQASSFPTALCNQVSALLDCSKLQYYVQAGSSFGSLSTAVSPDANGVLGNGSATKYPNTPSPAGTSSATPGGTPYVIVQVGYKWGFVTGLGMSYFNVPADGLLVSTAAFENEPY